MEVNGRLLNSVAVDRAEWGQLLRELPHWAMTHTQKIYRHAHRDTPSKRFPQMAYKNKQVEEKRMFIALCRYASLLLDFAL